VSYFILYRVFFFVCRFDLATKFHKLWLIDKSHSFYFEETVRNYRCFCSETQEIFSHMLSNYDNGFLIWGMVLTFISLVSAFLMTIRLTEKETEETKQAQERQEGVNKFNQEISFSIPVFIKSMIGVSVLYFGLFFVYSMFVCLIVKFLNFFLC
jgi:hypothetical protein